MVRMVYRVRKCKKNRIPASDLQLPVYDFISGVK